MWNYFIYPACLLAGFLIKTVIEKLGGDAAESKLKEDLRAALAEFKLELLKELRDEFVLAGGSDVPTGAEFQRRLLALEHRRSST